LPALRISKGGALPWIPAFAGMTKRLMLPERETGKRIRERNQGRRIQNAKCKVKNEE